MAMTRGHHARIRRDQKRLTELGPSEREAA